MKISELRGIEPEVLLSAIFLHGKVSPSFKKDLMRIIEKRGVISRYSVSYLRSLNLFKDASRVRLSDDENYVITRGGKIEILDPLFEVGSGKQSRTVRDVMREANDHETDEGEEI